MMFKGQPHITRQLAYLLPYLYSNPGVGMNIMIRAPSGWGKTRLSLMMCNYLEPEGSFQYSLGTFLDFDKKIRVHFVDEVHLVKEPEILYPVMDTGDYVIILATNDIAELPEALINRCTADLAFDDYSIPDLISITRSYLDFELPVGSLNYLVKCSGRNPRIIVKLAERLNIIHKVEPSKVAGIDKEGIKLLLENVFGIVDGLDATARRYLESLAKLGGTASLQTITTVTHIDASTIRQIVEPVLLGRGKIKITSKGRSIL